MTVPEAIKSWYEGVDCKSGNVFSENGVLYSYGHHWPLAMNRNGTMYINVSRYSNTTRSHLSQVLYTVRMRSIHVSRKLMLEVVDGAEPSLRDAVGDIPDNLHKALDNIGLKLTDDLWHATYGKSVLDCIWRPNSKGPELIVNLGEEVTVGSFYPMYRSRHWDPSKILREEI